jgi:uracil-DNA glycosylase
MLELINPKGWQKLFSREFEKDYFQHLNKSVKEAYQLHPNSIFPASHQIFRAFELCSLEDVRVVIIGQDPYPTAGHAHGLCFSVEPNVSPLPKSLQNIFKELESDLGTTPPMNGDLSRWAEQGALLLNTMLTVEEGKPNSHKDFGWQIFTDSIIEYINEHCENVVFLLWGNHAISKSNLINASKHRIFTSAHPSPLSAHRGFFGNRHFSLTNKYLELVGKKSIDW